MGRDTLILRYLGEDQTRLVLNEVHEDICNSHIWGKVFANKLLRARYYRLTLLIHTLDFFNKCHNCPWFLDLHHASTEILHSVTSPWPFYMSGVDILGKLPLEPITIILLVGVNYFTKCIETEEMSKITA